MRKLTYILLIFFNISYAQDILTTDMAVKLTLENNLDIKVSENILEISKNNSSILNSDYLLLCAKICGSSHYNMQMKIIVESEFL